MSETGCVVNNNVDLRISIIDQFELNSEALVTLAEYESEGDVARKGIFSKFILAEMGLLIQ